MKLGMRAVFCCTSSLIRSAAFASSICAHCSSSLGPPKPPAGAAPAGMRVTAAADALRAGNEVSAEERGVASTDVAARANADRLARGVSDFDRSREGVLGHPAVLERHAVAPEIEHALRPDSGLFGGGDRMRRVEWRLEAGQIPCRSLEVHRPVERARTAQRSTPQPLVVEGEHLAHVADADERRDAVVEKNLALVPQEVGEPVPQPGHDELAVGVDDLCAGRRRLTLSADRANAIAVDHQLGVTDRRPAAAVDERAPVDDEDPRRGGLRPEHAHLFRCGADTHTEEQDNGSESSHQNTSFAPNCTCRGATGRRDLPGVGIVRRAAVSRGDEDRRVGRAVIHPVEQVEHLGAQLEVARRRSGRRSC